MLKDVIDVRAIDGHRLWLRFDDDVEGEIDLRNRISFAGVFEPLADPAYFAKVRVNPDSCTIAWPNEADIDPLVLYSWVTHRDIQSILADKDRHSLQ